MKTITMLVLLVVLSAPQHVISQTTQEEYNYVTKGYKVQAESGLDMKKGYRFEDITTQSVQGVKGIVNVRNVIRQTEFKALFRTGEDKPCAILCIYTNSDKGFKDYICIPQFNSNQDLWNSMFAQIATYDGDAAKAVMWGLAKLSSYYSMK